ncbi:MAG TPA: hypothetical protein VFB73_13335 [Chloroflexota bacterium]|jgi:hypothetical protein|nr:hypothetical protein [Chloroflexota bacterium]
MSIRQRITTLGAVAILALAAGWAPGSPVGPPTAAATELARPSDHHSDHQRGHHPRHSGRWSHVHHSYRYFHGPLHVYPAEWYYWRHIRFPYLYVVYTYEPADVCFTEYYFYDGVFYCFVGE